MSAAGSFQGASVGAMPGCCWKGRFGLAARVAGRKVCP